MSREFQVTYDCADPAALAAFWAEVLGYDVQPPPDGFDSWPAALTAFGVPESEWNSRSAILPTDGDGPRVFFQRVPEGKVAKNRVHLDVRVASELRGDERMAVYEAEAERLVGLGATRVHRVDPDPPMEIGFLTMRDPEGNEFCLD
jgi:catechol 2,3-dioxygenase-like lactoylglutathione lyase family enzyme